MRHLIMASLLIVSSVASAQGTPKYAVLSLVGDKLTVVQREMSTGSRLDTNRRTEVDLPDASIDRAVTLAVDDAIRRTVPGAQPVLLASRRAALYDAALRDADGGVAFILNHVKPTLAKSGATHLVLVTKYRHRAMLRLRDGHVGSGFLEGVGFYVDHGTMARGVDTNEAESGFISPYTYMMISLVDLAGGRVVAQEPVIGSDGTSPTPSERNVGNAWQRLSDQEKLARLTRVIRDEASRAVPMVVARR